MGYVTFVSAEIGDWVAMYVDGRLVDEGHSLRPSDVIDGVMDLTVSGVAEFEVRQEWVEDNGLPSNLGEIPEEVRF